MKKKMNKIKKNLILAVIVKKMLNKVRWINLNQINQTFKINRILINPKFKTKKTINQKFKTMINQKFKINHKFLINHKINPK